MRMNIKRYIRQQINKSLNALGYEISRVEKNKLLPPVDYWWARRILYFKRLMDLAGSIDGDVVECGIGQGHTFFMLSALTALDAKKRNIWGFDSFEGFPKPSPEDASSRNPQAGDWSDVTVSEHTLHAMLQEGGIPSEFIEKRVNLVKGFFNESLPKFTGTNVAFLHLDVDLYQSYKETLDFFWHRVAKGGVVLFDEYKQPGVEDAFPGAVKAIDEFFGEQRRMIQYDKVVKRYYIVK